MQIPHRALGIVREIVTEMGHEVTYAYEDLIFSDHNAYLLQFTDTPDTLNLYFNIELSDEDGEAIAKKLNAAADTRHMSLVNKGHYELSENADDAIDIKFFNKENG
ncbi:MAG: hypothetical protein ISR54_10730 [Chlorobium phaeobacteroides]|uniref:Uncharacterized protein n=1 Tax=Chlorobium phaeobacteroides (strain BS1) TaxID=331678 RepID=B3EKN7_CHLPB|nr:hypothetical protein [Chlorobium phaeobacteroides]